jgi:hypothetical protein
MMEWANFYSGVSRGLATIVGYADGRDFDYTSLMGYSKELKRIEQVISSQSSIQRPAENQSRR